MPITLEKLFSPVATTSFTWMDEVVHVSFAPFRYTGEMQELAQQLAAEDVGEQNAVDELRAEAAAALAEATEIEGQPGYDEDESGVGDHVLELRARADDLARQADERSRERDLHNRAALREMLAVLLVTWDVLEGTTPFPTDVPHLKKLPDPFLRAVFMAMSAENQPDPQKAPDSEPQPSTEKGSAPSPTGSNSSPRRARSASRRSSSTSAPSVPVGTRSGGHGR